MKTHQLFDAVEKLLPHAEAEQESLYQMAKQNPDEYQAGYEDCRHAVSYAYEACANIRKPNGRQSAGNYRPTRKGRTTTAQNGPDARLARFKYKPAPTLTAH